MIITCNNCNKKFDIDSTLIPDKGRLLQCASCEHKWFFKKEVLENKISPINEDTSINNVNIFDQKDHFKTHVVLKPKSKKGAKMLNKITYLIGWQVF